MKLRLLITTLLASLLSILIHACEQQPKISERKVVSSGGNQASGEAEPNDPVEEEVKDFTLAWDTSTDASIVGYKVFLIPPGSLSRAPGSDGPIEIKSMALTDLTADAGKYAVTISQTEVVAQLAGRTVSPDDYCFTLVAVNDIGNSTHSPRICPNKAP